MKNRLKLLTLFVCIAAAIISSVVYVLCVGSHYTFHTNTFLGTDKAPYTEVKLSNESVAKMTGVRMENEELVFEFDALNPGTTAVNISYDFGDVMIPLHERTFEVSSFGILIDRTEGIIKFNGFKFIVYAALFVLFVIQFIMLWMFSDYWKKGEFSYPMVACGGIGIYNLVLFAYILYRMLNSFIDSLSILFVLVTETAHILLFGLTPVMLVISVLLAISNIWLMRNEGKRPVNALGIVFAVLWFAGMVLTFGANEFIMLWGISYPKTVWLILIYVIAYFECMFLSTVACTYLATKYTPAYDRDYIIILGCAIRKDGSLTPILKGRVDAALSFAEKQFKKTGNKVKFVPSGGQGSDEVVSEGEAMRRYLTEQGIEEERILPEMKSVNTFENMKFSKEIIEADAGEKYNATFATTNYHVFRGYILAKKLGLKNARGISSKTKWYFFPNAFLREFVGLIVDKWKLHLLVLVSIILTFTGIVLFLY